MDPRERMVDEIRSVYGLDAPRVFSAMLKVPRECFVGEGRRYMSYADAALPIGFGQTISQPYTVAFMTNLLALKGEEKVLEIGTGSGYQAAILSFLAKEVYTIERIPRLARQAEKTLRKLGFKNIKVRAGQGEFGWKDFAPYDAILVTAGVEEVPKGLFDQLKVGGVLVAPVGEGEDKVMTKYKKGRFRISKRQYGVFSFVPFVSRDSFGS